MPISHLDIVEEFRNENPMPGSKTCRLNGLTGIKHLDRVGIYLVIANKSLYDSGTSHRYTLINETERSVHSVHGSQHAAVVFAQKHIR